MPLDAILARLDQTKTERLSRLLEVLRFPSVGTDPAHAGDCRACAEWLRRDLESMGFQAELRQTTGQPLVVGKLNPKSLPRAAPHILFYGHYDVQPADPLNLWVNPPFEPQVRRGKGGGQFIFARGASDDKGQVMTFLEACRAWLAVEGRLPFRLTVLIEGDEEGDSTHLDRFLAKHRKEFACDSAFICDTGLWNNDTPAVNVMLRGCIGEELEITGPRIDLHSGYYGGPATNPIKVLSRVLGALHDARGKVTIPGFYDGVKAPTAAQRRQLAKLKFSARKFLGEVGLAIPAGEQQFSALEQMWFRPTAEVNGIWGGYRGPGNKTVLPAAASAKLTFRLVEGQDPRAVRKAFRAFVRSRLPEDCRATFAAASGDSTGIVMASGNPFVASAKRALEAEWGKPAAEIGTGGSIPVVESFRNHLGVDSVMVGFSRDDDGAHSPNENYAVTSFHKGARSWARIFAELS